ncbi:MAG: hypothetical protein QOI46_6422 [Alphaproteobacteria bacterium]|nr:hypothetical protein [Alphaproteobacteria bacterium]
MKMDDKTVLVTGSTDGVGRYVAAKLAADGAKVLIHGRDRNRAKTLADEIRRAGHGEAIFYQADLSSLAGAQQLAQAVLADHKRLDVFISNAGIGSRTGGAERRESADGYELRFAVNYLSGFLLAHLLLPLLKASAPSRIVNVASLGQHPIDFDDVMLTKGYSGSRAYAQSKLAQIMFTIDLARELGGSGVTVNSLHPATYMNTTMVREAASRRSVPWSRAARRSCASRPVTTWLARPDCSSMACERRKPIPRLTMVALASDYANSALS